MVIAGDDLNTPATTAGQDPLRRRVAVIGDVAGHIEELRDELRRLGADHTTGALPADLTVIQVGDLVHRGPASDAVVQLVDGYLNTQPGQWIQLVGNHEAHYLRRPVFEWPERIATESIASIQRWWANGQMQAATAVTTPAESFLITHAGLTAGFWRSELGGPRDVEQAAAAINALIGTQDDVLFRAGQMLHNGRKDRVPGPLWAATATELVPGWVGRLMPFSQVHGHASIFDWKRREYSGTKEISSLTTVDENLKHETVRLDGGRIIGIDPGHARQPRRPWSAWEIVL